MLNNFCKPLSIFQIHKLFAYKSSSHGTSVDIGAKIVCGFKKYCHNSFWHALLLSYSMWRTRIYTAFPHYHKLFISTLIYCFTYSPVDKQFFVHSSSQHKIYRNQYLVFFLLAINNHNFNTSSPFIYETLVLFWRYLSYN